MTDPQYRSDAYLRSCPATVVAHTDAGGLVTEPTIFYPQGGGQPGDSGSVEWDGKRMVVATTLKGDGNTSVMLLAEPAPLPPIGSQVTLHLDWDRRHAHMRVHTALHLLSVVIPLPVTGGSISAGKGRLDFDMPDAPADTAEIEAALNTLIDRDLVVSTEWITDDELAANPGLVKTMSVQPPTGQGRVRLVRIGDVDLQPCGGTHVARTAEIGRVSLGRIEKKGRINRRVSITLDD